VSTATPETYTLSLHDALPIYGATIFNSLAAMVPILCKQPPGPGDRDHSARLTACAATPRDLWSEFERRFGVRIVEGYGLTETARSEEHTSELQSRVDLVCRLL